MPDRPDQVQRIGLACLRTQCQFAGEVVEDEQAAKGAAHAAFVSQVEVLGQALAQRDRCAGGGSARGGGGTAAGQRDLVGAGVAEPHVVELDARRPGRQRDGVGLLGHGGGQVEDLEDPLEGDQGGHHVDAHVAQGGQRAVETRQQRGDGQQRADRAVQRAEVQEPRQREQHRRAQQVQVLAQRRRLEHVLLDRIHDRIAAMAGVGAPEAGAAVEDADLVVDELERGELRERRGDRRAQRVVEGVDGAVALAGDGDALPLASD